MTVKPVTCVANAKVGGLSLAARLVTHQPMWWTPNVALERRLAEVEAEASRRQRVLDGLNARVEEAQAEMMERSEATSELTMQALTIEGELKTRNEDHHAIMVATRAKKAELESALSGATARGNTLDADLNAVGYWLLHHGTTCFDSHVARLKRKRKHCARTLTWAGGVLKGNGKP